MIKHRMYSLPIRFHVVLEPRRPSAHASACDYVPPSTSKTSVCLGVLLAVSEALPLTTRVKANGIIDAAKLLFESVAPASPSASENLTLALPLPTQKK